MEHKPNELKANEICKKHIFDSNHVDCCMEMAEWKDEQEIEFLQSLMFQSATQNVFKMINNRIKLLKGE